MEQNEELEMQVFQIISAVGTARSCYIEAIHAAKGRDYEQAAELLKKGDVSFAEGHDSHLELLGREAEGEAEGKAEEEAETIACCMGIRGRRERRICSRRSGLWA